MCMLLPLLSGCAASLPVAWGNAGDTAPPDEVAGRVAFSPPPPVRTPAPTAVGTVGYNADTPRAVAAARQALFEKTWRTVNEYYVDPDFNDVAWDAVWQEFLPQVRAAETDAAFYALMQAMVTRLGDNHSRFLPPAAAVAEEATYNGNGTQYGVGIVTYPSSHGLMIQHVFANSPASNADLRPRDRIVQINDLAPPNGSALHGAAGSTVKLTVLRPADNTLRTVSLTRQHVAGRISPSTHRLPNNIGYLAIPTLWVDDIDRQVSSALTDLVVQQQVQGLVLDLRGNPGGWRSVMTGILGHFVQGRVGTFYSRHANEALRVDSTTTPDLRGVPLAVLIDENTASYAEVLAAVLQAEADAYIVGVPSAGNTETIYAYELEDGSRLWLAQEDFRLRSGDTLEDRGVQPDETITTDWTLSSLDDDPHIRAAHTHLLGQ